MLRVYKDQGKYEEALNILEDERKGFASPVGNRSWELALQMIELQGICGRWKVQWHSCQEILRHARPKKFQCENSRSNLAFGERGDDWKIWDFLVMSTTKLASDEPESVSLAIFG